MISNRRSVRSKKWLVVFSALAAMIASGSFAVATINDPANDAPILIGDSINSSGTVGTTNTLQWAESADTTVTPPAGFTDAGIETTSIR